MRKLLISISLAAAGGAFAQQAGHGHPMPTNGYAVMQSRAQGLGAQVVAEEASLDKAFKARTIDETVDARAALNPPRRAAGSTRCRWPP